MTIFIDDICSVYLRDKSHYRFECETAYDKDCTSTEEVMIALDARKKEVIDDLIINQWS